MSEYQQRYEAALATKPGDLWIHRKNGKQVMVVVRTGPYGTMMSHENNSRRTMILAHVLASNYGPKP